MKTDPVDVLVSTNSFLAALNMRPYFASRSNYDDYELSTDLNKRFPSTNRVRTEPSEPSKFDIRMDVLTETHMDSGSPSHPKVS
jgi:hypothetical protein